MFVHEPDDEKKREATDGKGTVSPIEEAVPQTTWSKQRLSSKKNSSRLPARLLGRPIIQRAEDPFSGFNNIFARLDSDLPPETSIEQEVLYDVGLLPQIHAPDAAFRIDTNGTEKREVLNSQIDIYNKLLFSTGPIVVFNEGTPANSTGEGELIPVAILLFDLHRKLKAEYMDAQQKQFLYKFGGAQVAAWIYNHITIFPTQTEAMHEMAMNAILSRNIEAINKVQATREDMLLRKVSNYKKENSEKEVIIVFGKGHENNLLKNAGNYRINLSLV